MREEIVKAKRRGGDVRRENRMKADDDDDDEEEVEKGENKQPGSLLPHSTRLKTQQHRQHQPAQPLKPGANLR